MVRNGSPTRRSVLLSGLCASLLSARVQAQDVPELVLQDGPQILPPFKVKRGEIFRLRVKNERHAPTAFHWRGVRLRNDMDGGAPLTQKPISPGETFDVAFTPPDSGTFLCHANWRANAASDIADGVIFPFLVEDDKDPAVDADLMLLLQEKKSNGAATLGMTINGSEMAPTHDLRPGARVRLRIASGSTQRIMSVALEGTKSRVAAIDGQPCGLFEPDRQTLPLVPGQRYDLFFDLPREDGHEVSLHLRSLGGDTKAASLLASFRTSGELVAERPTFAGLPSNSLLPEKIALQSAMRRDLVFARNSSGGWLINGQAGDAFAPTPLFKVKRGTPVVLGFINKTGQPQLIHPHGHVMRHIHLFDDGWDPYWRDTIIVPERRTMRVAFVADNPGRWPLNGGMDGRDGPTSWFEVS